MKLEDLVNYIDEILDSKSFKDYGPNGLQIEGRGEVKKIVTGVSSCVELFEIAAEKKADAVLVHHGIFWDGQSAVITKSRKERIKTLLQNDISLIAYHLPLDAHPVYGNNAGIVRALGLVNTKPFADYKGKTIGFIGEYSRSLSQDEVFSQIKNNINADAIFYNFGTDPIKTAAVCSGGAQSAFNEAIEKKADLFITGEQSEWIYHLAKEEKIHYAAAGHHATERFGAKLLGVHLAEKFGLDVEFVDVFNPI